MKLTSVRRTLKVKAMIDAGIATIIPIINLINNNSSDSQVLFSTVNRLLRPTNVTSSTTEQCNNFLHLFHDKTHSIYNKILNLPPISTFPPVTRANVTKLVRQMNNTTCFLNRLPASLVQTCLPTLVQSITDIIKAFLNSGTVPVEHKHAVVTPIVKKQGTILDSSLAEQICPTEQGILVIVLAIIARQNKIGFDTSPGAQKVVGSNP